MKKGPSGGEGAARPQFCREDARARRPACGSATSLFLEFFFGEARGLPFVRARSLPLEVDKKREKGRKKKGSRNTHETQAEAAKVPAQGSSKARSIPRSAAAPSLLSLLLRRPRSSHRRHQRRLFFSSSSPSSSSPSSAPALSHDGAKARAEADQGLEAPSGGGDREGTGRRRGRGGGGRAGGAPPLGVAAAASAAATTAAAAAAAASVASALASWEDGGGRGGGSARARDATATPSPSRRFLLHRLLRLFLPRRLVPAAAPAPSSSDSSSR